ncbi:hypothetical protein PMAYCL1PPCAC_24985, partial [Pristionchus mayeri]
STSPLGLLIDERQRVHHLSRLLIFSLSGDCFRKREIDNLLSVNVACCFLSEITDLWDISRQVEHHIIVRLISRNLGDRHFFESRR